MLVMPYTAPDSFMRCHIPKSGELAGCWVLMQASTREEKLPELPRDDKAGVSSSEVGGPDVAGAPAPEVLLEGP